MEFQMDYIDILIELIKPIIGMFKGFIELIIGIPVLGVVLFITSKKRK